MIREPYHSIYYHILAQKMMVLIDRSFIYLRWDSNRPYNAYYVGELYDYD